jgi:acyl carrier protein
MTTGVDIRTWVRRYLAELLGIPLPEVRLDCPLSHYGLSSVDAVRMGGELEDQLNIEIDPAAFLRLPTVEHMIEALERQQAERGPAP